MEWLRPLNNVKASMTLNFFPFINEDHALVSEVMDLINCVSILIFLAHHTYGFYFAFSLF